MNLNEIIAASSVPPTAANTGAPSKRGEMGKEEFLKLLVTQLSNQDPMSPLESQEFAAQLAQFTSVEQLVNMNRSLGQADQTNALLARSINSGIAAGLIGKSVEAEGNGVRLSGSGSQELSFRLDAPAAEVKVTVRDASGNVVRVLTEQQVDAGTQRVEWDGKDAAGARVPEGAYTFEVSAAGADGQPVPAATLVRGVVQKVTYSAEEILLWVNGSSLPMGAVRSVE